MTNGNQDNKGRFVKGNKANPLGAKAQTRRRKKQDVVDFCKRHTLEAMQIAMRIARDDEKSASDRLKAVQIISDRGYGKPETAGNHASGLFAGATIMVDTGIKRELEPPVVDVTPNGVDHTESKPD